MDLTKILKPFCRNKKIIIVGNSRSLLEDKKGQRIDAFDVVVRMNHGYPRQDWAEYTGSKTDIWVCAYNNTALQPKEYDIFKPRYALRLNNETHIHPGMKPVFLRWDMEEWQKVKHVTGIRNYPSTGLVTIYFFLEYLGVDHLTITGFDFFRQSNFYQPANHRIKAAQWHTPRKEKTFVQQYIKDQKISLLT